MSNLDELATAIWFSTPEPDTEIGRPCNSAPFDTLREAVLFVMRMSVDERESAMIRTHGGKELDDKPAANRRFPLALHPHDVVTDFVVAVDIRSRGVRINQCPLCPRKRTCAVQIRMSSLGQKRTHAVQQFRPLLDHLVGGILRHKLDHP